MAQPIVWRKANGPVGTNTYLIRVLPGSIILAATDRGIYRSTDAGSTWTGPAPSLGPSLVTTIVATRSGRLIAHATTGPASYSLWRSDDSGTTWQQITGAWQGEYIRGLAASPDGGTLFAASDSGIFISSDGIGWQATGGRPIDSYATYRFWQLAVAPDGALLAAAYFSKGGDIFRSYDSARTWTHTEFYDVSDGAWFTVDDTTMLLVTNTSGPNAGNGIARSVDGGGSWRFITDPHWFLSLTRMRDGTVLGATREGLVISTDRGATWRPDTTTLPGGYVSCITQDSAGELIACADHALLFSHDSGRTWEGRSPAQSAVHAILVDSVNEYLTGTYGNGIQASADAGATWTDRSTGLPATDIYTLYRDHRGRTYAGTGAGVWVSDNEGRIWRQTLTMEGLQEAVSILEDGNGTMFAALRYKFVSRSRDGGEHWESVGADIPYGVSFNCLALDSTGAIYVATSERGIYRSTDGGNVWTPASNGLPNQCRVQTIAVAPDGRIYANVNYTLYASSDRGESWISAGASLRGYLYSMLFDRAGTMYAGTDAGVRVSRDNGRTWIDADSGLGVQFVLALALDRHGRLLAGTSGGGMFITDAPVAGVTRDPAPVTGGNVTRCAVYPNPATGIVGIRLIGSSGRHVRIRLYDPTGNCVAPQVDRDVSSGTEMVTISVAALPTGMYIYRIDDGSMETNGKFLVVR